MSIDIEELRKRFPSVTFSHVTERINHRNEGSTYYPLGAPKPEKEEGSFIRIQNVHGGADTLYESDMEGILKLAEWHEGRAKR